MAALPAGLRAFAYASYAISALVLGGGYVLWQGACVPPSDTDLTTAFDVERASFDELRNLALEDHRRLGPYILGSDLRFRTLHDGARAEMRTAADLPQERAARYRTLLGVTGTRLLCVQSERHVQFEVWAIHGTPGQMRGRGFAWCWYDPAKAAPGSWLRTEPLGGHWYLYDEAD